MDLVEFKEILFFLLGPYFLFDAGVEVVMPSGLLSHLPLSALLPSAGNVV